MVAHGRILLTSSAAWALLGAGACADANPLARGPKPLNKNCARETERSVLASYGQAPPLGAAIFSSYERARRATRSSPPKGPSRAPPERPPFHLPMGRTTSRAGTRRYNRSRLPRHRPAVAPSRPRPSDRRRHEGEELALEVPNDPSRRPHLATPRPLSCAGSRLLRVGPWAHAGSRASNASPTPRPP
jgi:hypothetical protein